MGTDNLFHKLKDKANNKRKREQGKKEPYPKFLIVCEDTVSGKNYLLEAIKQFRISTANFCIVGLGQDPLNIVQHAENRYNDEYLSNKPDFDKVFCVFDRDEHQSYYNAIKKVDAINKKLACKELVFEAITSDPCFEIWLILHFTYTTQLFVKSQRKTASNQVLDELKNYMPDYQKNSHGVFLKTCCNLGVAIENSEKLRIFCEAHYVETPSTCFGKLMSFIMNLKE